MRNNIWILTEERPKASVLQIILQKIAADEQWAAFISTLKILPVLENDKFTFTYEVIGFNCNRINKIFIKTVSGYSSFVDYLIFLQKESPTENDMPIYAIEETKTDDKESRNTGVFQRCTKFVFIEHYYPEVKKIMLYHLQIEQKEKPTETYVFGTKLLMTLGVEILGKQLDSNVFKPFENIDEIISLKDKMRKAPKGNVGILLTKTSHKIQVSGRLYKSNGLSHDPNIGALSLICAVLRKLGWENRLEIISHGLEQQHVGKTNKFIQIANSLNIELENLLVPRASFHPKYWKYETEGEKLGTIFIHLAVEYFTTGFALFENHAGCEKSYFLKADGTPIPLVKYEDRAAYKAGDKSKINHIPDLVLIDIERLEIINIEGKKYKFRKQGIEELANYDFIEEYYIKRDYSDYKIIRTVVLYGSHEE
ncbi:MAG: hypothetical protein RL757_606, partial [Bacteroidota bacterium]